MNSTNKEIDFLEVALNIWNKRWFVIKSMIIGSLIGIIVAVSLPKEFLTIVMLAPEAKSSSNSNMGALAAMAGINFQQSSNDAISTELYPSILSSTSFLVGLFDIKVQDGSKKNDSDIYNYLKNDQNKPWWSYISEIFHLFLSKKDENSISIHERKEIKLTADQFMIVEDLRNRINVSVDKKTGLISLSCIMQDPYISAFIADTVTTYLQEYIIEYRTKKAKQDLLYTQKLYEEAKDEYYEAQKEYTTYTDRNLNIVSARYGAIKERLENEVSLSYTVYNQMAQQLQLARVKVQDTTPVYTVIQAAVVPLIPVSPKKKVIVLTFIVLSFIGACSWVLVKKYFIK